MHFFLLLAAVAVVNFIHEFLRFRSCRSIGYHLLAIAKDHVVRASE